MGLARFVLTAPVMTPTNRIVRRRCLEVSRADDPAAYNALVETVRRLVDEQFGVLGLNMLRGYSPDVAILVDEMLEECN